jgi:hypothetical protein
MDKTTPMKTLTDRQININKTFCLLMVLLVLLCLFVDGFIGAAFSVC